MSFDLCVWKAAVAPSPDEARETYEALLAGDPSGLVESPDVAAFSRDLARRFTWLRTPDTEPGEDGFEFAADDWHAWLGVPWVALSRIGPVVEELARRHELVMFDPQSGEVHLPPSLGGVSTTDWAAAAEPGLDAVDELTAGLVGSELTGNLEADLEAAMRRMIEQSGMTFSSPGGPMIGPDNLDDLGSLFRLDIPPFVEPPPLDPRRQTPTALEARVRDLRSDDMGRRNSALIQLAGWTSSPDVLEAVRSALDDPEACVRGYAVHALGHLKDDASTGHLVDIALDLAAEPARDWHGIDMAAEGAVYAIHGCALLRPDPGDTSRLLAALPKLRPTGASFEQQLASIRADLG